MNVRMANIVAAIVLGVLLPMLFVSFLHKIKTPDDRLSEIETTVYDENADVPVERYIAVMRNDQTVQRIPIEQYVVAVVLKEMPASFEVEALKAQAVVARTYALRRNDKGSKHENADVCTRSSCCQGYCSIEEYLEKGGRQENIDKVSMAVEATSGLVVVYDGKLIDATYFSCSGGMTENAVEVWGTDVPYLQAVESPGEETAKHYVDTVKMETAEFVKLLGLKDNKIVIGDITYTEGGGVDTVQICGENYEGTQLRNILHLRSTAFYITSVGSSVTITTKGFGHRVGMSQYGADAMAVDGASFEEILSHYYIGTKIISYVLD